MKRLLQKIALHPLYIRWTHWEFWPLHIIYIPVYIQHLWLAAKARSFFFFLRTNPAIDDGLLLDDPKYKTLQLIPQEYLPKTILITTRHSIEDIRQLMQKAAIDFPVILKPNIGYRGLQVDKIKDDKQLRNFIQTINVDYLIQEYIDFPLEIGVFYYRLPNSEKGEIPSVTCKEFLKVTGDGKSTLAMLVSQKPRAILQAKKLAKKFQAQWHNVIPKGEEILLEGIGSHNRGTKFINANALRDEALQRVFDELNSQMQGFYFGRFDIRTATIEDLKQGKNFKILEVNGVGAEPTHIYDPNYKLFKAWKELLHLWRIIYHIARQNQQNGITFPTLAESKEKWKRFHKSKKALTT